MQSFVDEFVRALETLGDIPEDERERNREEAKRRFQQLPRLPLPKERDQATLEAFFTEEVLTGRVLICPEIPYDRLDCWEIFGNEPGFIYIVGLKPGWQKPGTLSEEAWVQGTLVSLYPGVTCGFIPSYAHFPLHMLDYELLTDGRDRAAFAYLATRIRIPVMAAKPSHPPLQQ